MPTETISLDNGALLTIRDAQVQDAVALLRYLDTIGGETDFLTFGAYEFSHSLEEEEAYIQECLHTDNKLLILGLINDEIVGVLHFTGEAKRRMRHSGEFGVSVPKAHWGLGIGSHLIRAMIEWAKAGEVIRKINLRVRSDNVRAIRLYEKFGFTREGEISREFLIDGIFYSNIFMGMPID